jgi:chromosome segregation ATPase
MSSAGDMTLVEEPGSQLQQERSALQDTVTESSALVARTRARLHEETDDAEQSLAASQLLQPNNDDIVQESHNPSLQDIHRSSSSLQSRDRSLKTRRKLRQLELELRKVKHERDHVIENNKEIQKYNDRLRGENQEHKQTADRMRQEKANIVERAKRVENDYGQVNEIKEDLEKDNEELRWVIANLSNPRQPLRNEDYYQRQFSSINGEVETWAAVQSKKATADSFTPACQDEIISILNGLGDPTVTESGEYLKTRLAKLYKKRPTRIVLIRHVIGLYLFAAVFKRYVFGFDDEWSTYFHGIEDRLLQQGSSMVATTNSRP